MNHDRAPILEAISEHRRNERYGFTPPAHRQGRGVDPSVLDVLGTDVFASDLVATGGLDDRTSSNDIDGLRVMERELLAVSASAEYDPFHIVLDLDALGVTGFWAADWLRAERGIDAGVSDHRRVEFAVSPADDDDTAARLADALRALVQAAERADAAPRMYLPTPDDLSLETVMRPRDAFFGPVEVVSADEAVGRVAAEQITPYPPGIPVILPGERIGEAVLRYLRTGLECGLVIPDSGDTSLETIRVVREAEPGRTGA